MEQDKRGYRDADDPRNLFAAMYGGVYKRSDPYELDFRWIIKYVKGVPKKRRILSILKT